MSSTSTSSGSASGKKIAAIVLAVVGVICIIVGIIYFAEPAHALPGILGTIKHPRSRADTNRPLRAATALVVGVILVVAAGFTAKGRKPAGQEPAETARASSNS